MNMDRLNNRINEEVKKNINILENYSFKVICNSLIKLLNEGKTLYKEKRLEESYIRYMRVINIYCDELPKLKNYNKNIKEYKNLKNELGSACDIIEELKRELQKNKK